MNKLSIAVLSTLAIAGTVRAQDADTVTPSGIPIIHHPVMNGISWVRGYKNPIQSAIEEQMTNTTVSAKMVNHGGQIITMPIVKEIFWGTSWPSYHGDKMTGLGTWYKGFGSSHYANTSHEYTGTNGTVGNLLAFQGYVVDSSASTGGSSTGPILAEVCKEITAGKIVPDANGRSYIPVYTDTPRGGANFCAWHSAGSCQYNGQWVTLQFAYFFDLDGDPGCDPQDSETGHSQGLAALANVSGHELSESRTDPWISTWYDAAGQENGDKCAWTFNVPYVTFSNASIWKIQGEWSNGAYVGNRGYPNASGQLGCLDGH